MSRERWGGEVLVAEGGDLVGALKAYRDALVIAERLDGEIVGQGS